MKSDEYLSDEEVADLTGYVQPKRQARWLVQNGIRPLINGRGKVRILRGSEIAQRSVKSKTEPDFTRVRRTG